MFVSTFCLRFLFQRFGEVWRLVGFALLGFSTT